MCRHAVAVRHSPNATRIIYINLYEHGKRPSTGELNNCHMITGGGWFLVIVCSTFRLYSY